jgi:hypothetical protein
MAFSSDDDDYGDYYGGGFSDDDWGSPSHSPVPPKKEIPCECKQCRESALGKFDVCHPREYYPRRERIERQILSEYTERNGHLAEGDPTRHSCGNGAMEKRRYLILEYRGFCVHVANPSKPMPYMTTDGGVGYAFGRPLRPGEIRNNEAFQNSVKTAEGMTVSDYRRLIDDFYRHHEMFDSQSAAFPHHHTLAMASMGSTCATLEMSIPIHLSFRSNMDFERAFLQAKKRAQNPFEITRFTQMSDLQKNMILAHSGIAGLAIFRLFSTTHVPNQRHRLKLSHFVVRRVHSRAECEIFADNRYGKSGAAEPVAALADDSLTLEMATDELRALYIGHIQAIMRKIRQMKRGLLNAEDILAIPEFQRMHRLWFNCFQQVIAEYEDEIQYEDGDYFRKMEHVSKMVGEFPLLYSSEMMSIYSKNSATLAKNAISMLIEMASNQRLHVGCRAGLLAFAAVEPRMVDQYLAPRLELCAWDGNDRYQALENHIPSRCPIFGALRKKFQVHLPRTGDCEWEMCRKKGGTIRSFIPYTSGV